VLDYLNRVNRLCVEHMYQMSIELVATEILGGMLEMIYNSTTHLATKIREGEFSAVETVEAHLAQIEQHNPALNAVVTLDAESAIQRAQEADAALAQGVNWGPLHGVPFTLKDAHATAGMRTTVGFPMIDHVPQHDGTVAARLKAAGGILMGKTNVHILLGDPLQTDNPIFGRTNNPWDVERTPGGSSGGSAAAVASGMTPFDIGTDLAGSVRIPAHFCGLFGLKPTENRVSLAGVIPGLNAPRSVRLMSCLGPLTRTVDDLALLYGIIAGPDGRDTEIQPVPIAPVSTVELKGLRIAIAPQLAGFPVATDIRAAVADLGQELSRLGVIVDEAPLPDLNFGDDLSRAGALIGMMVGVFQPNADPISLADYLTALDQRDRSIIAWEEFFTNWDVLLCPPSMLTAFTHCEPGSPLQVDDHDQSYWLANAHTTLFNFTGHPALVLPYRQAQDGMPIGVQLVAKRWADSQFLGIAQAISSVTGHFQRPAGY
jgi:amidase